MKLFLRTLIILAIPGVSFSQTRTADSLRRNLKTAKTDSARFVALKGLADDYIDVNIDTALLYLNEAIGIAKKNQQWLDVAIESDWKANQLGGLNKLPEAYRNLQTALMFADDPANDKKTWVKNKNLTYQQYRLYVLANIYEDLGHLAENVGDAKGQLQAYQKGKSIALQSGDKTMAAWLDMNIGEFYIGQKLPDSAIIYVNTADILSKETGEKKIGGLTNLDRGEIYALKGDTIMALAFYRAAARVSFKNDMATLSNSYIRLANYFLSSNQPDSSLFYSQKLMETIRSARLQRKEATAYQLLYKSYLLKNKRDSAFKYLQLSYEAFNSNTKLHIKSLTDVQKLLLQDQIRLDSLEKEKEQAQSRVRIYALSAAIGVFMLLAVIFYRNNRQKQKANHLLKEQKQEIERQRDNLGKALDELKTAQTQLIQSEKMASLGELTAGIAHEIQNPLNFVNNFSEVSKELLGELKEELDKGDIEEAKLISGDVIQNLEKINHHGKRADAIVKGMLEHSRVSSGKKEPTDINALADKYLRLSYHGLRAKDKNFNAEMVTNFDVNLPKISVIPQDIGRVFLNLFNNAFYAVNQKAKTAGAEYKPEVSVTTSHENGKVIIVVKDNGVGIPDAIKDKIMQPFFTTKPTGEGTGLGLSLSYDIVVKGHGGTITVDTKENEFTEFTLTLPIS